MSDDDLTLTPVYRFEWSDGTVRQTDDHDAITRSAEWSPDAVEHIAQLAREDPECEAVILLGMGG